MCEVQNEVQNASENVNKDELPETLYHYCSLDTFYNIVKNKSIWLSDLSKTNDSQELIWLKGIVKKKLLPEAEKNIKKEESSWDEWKVTQALLEHSDFKLSCWGFCLSKKKDNLGQWRGYADDGAGIAIGFKYNELRKLIPSTKISNFESNEESKSEESKRKPDLAFNVVFYKTEENLFKEVSEKADKKIKNNPKVCAGITKLVNELKEEGRPYVEIGSDSAKVLVTALIAITEFPFYKSTAFEEEEEWRIVFSMPRERVQMRIEECYDWPSPLSFKEFGFNNAFISHFDIGIENFKDVIQSITIGPKSKLTEADIELILRCYDVYNESIKIEKSAASYR